MVKHKKKLVSGLANTHQLTKKFAGQTLLKISTPVESWMRNQVEENIRKILAKLKPVTVKALKEDDMWPCVKRIIDEFVEELWPELEEEVIYLMRFKFDEPP